MKKLKLLILLLFIPLIICSCEKKEYNLIPITSEELVKNLTSKKNIVFAIVDYSEDDTEQFLKDLKNVSKSANINIYYIDYLHIDMQSGFMLFNTYSTDFTTNAFHVIQNETLVISNEYINFKEMYTLLKGKNFKNEIIRIDNKTKKSHIKEAQKLYKENKISEAHEELCYAWDLKEAQEEHNNNKYYNLINVWERTIYSADLPEKTTYTTMGFYSGVNYYAFNQKTQLSEEFDNTQNSADTETIYYRIENDIIYTSNREKGYYEETYKINDIDNKLLQLTNLKTNKNETYIRRNDV